MVATKQEKVLLVLDLVAHEKADRLQPALIHACAEAFAQQQCGGCLRGWMLAALRGSG